MKDPRTHKTEQLRELHVATINLGSQLLELGELILENTGLTVSRSRLLGVLQRAGSALTIAEIAGALGQSRQATASLVGKMARDGLVERKVNPKHGRAFLVEPTSLGRDEYKRSNLRQTNFFDGIIERFDMEEIDQANAVLKKLSAITSRALSKA